MAEGLICQQLLLSTGLLLPVPSTQGLDLLNIIQTIQHLSLTHFMPMVLLKLHIQVVQINTGESLKLLNLPQPR